MLEGRRGVPKNAAIARTLAGRQDAFHPDDDDEEEDEDDEADDSDLETRDDDPDNESDEEDPSDVEDSAAKKPNGKAASPTSTTTPAGIREHDPEAVNGKGHKPSPARPPQEPFKSQPSHVQLHQIVVSKHNPRRSFDDAALAELAESIKAHGILQDMLVRPLGGGMYELVSGERRMRAAKLAGLKGVRVTIAEITEEQAAEIRLVENLQREDLTPIEEAAGYQDLVKRFQYSQQQLAAKLGRSQAHVAQMLALLKLPEVWQEKLITRVITPTHARALASFAEHPRLLEKIAKEIGGDPIRGHKDFQGQVTRAARCATEVMHGDEYSYDFHRRIPIFKPTAEQRAQLEIVTIGKEERAVNSKLWEQLQTAHVKAIVKRDAGKGKAKSKNDAAPKLSPAELKARAKKLADQFKRRVHDWRENWLRSLLARYVEMNPEFGSRIVLMGLSETGHAGSYRDVGLVMGIKESNNWRRNRGPNELETTIAGLADCRPTFADLAIHWLWKAKENVPANVFFSPELDVLAAAAGIDLDEAWSSGYSKSFCSAFWNLHGKAQLIALAAELKIKGVDESMPKGDIIETIDESAEGTLKMPKEIERVKALAVAKTKKAKR